MKWRRRGRHLPLIDNLWRDIRVAFRMLHRAPSVSVPAVLVLALGIGTATALYAIVYAMWLRPLPYPDAGRLVSVTTYFGGYKLDALALALGGVVIGLAAALAGSRLLASLLFQVNPRDPLTLATTAALLVVLAICASVVPARRASQQDPAQTLRAE